MEQGVRKLLGQSSIAHQNGTDRMVGRIAGDLEARSGYLRAKLDDIGDQ